VQRALKVGALHGIIPPATLRPYLIEALARAEEGQGQATVEKVEVIETERAVSAA
jgi:hypothetical protein